LIGLTMHQTIKPLASSFRDPSGFVFEKDGILYRQVNKIFQEDFDHFIESGCYDHLVKKQWLIPHEEVSGNFSGSYDWYKTLKPQKIPFISYPYEWCFDMMKDAALLTLAIMKECMSFEVMLKDASPYNIQWHSGKLIFIDTLSFEKYDSSKPWIAYRQFCECFLGPLLLMHYNKQALQQLQIAWPDGIPLNIIQSLLPGRSKFSLSTYLHIHLHNRISSKKQIHENRPQKFSKQKFLNLISSFEALINKLKAPSTKSTWSGYYEEVFGRKDYLPEKKKIISEWLNQLTGIKTAADLGANEGEFSKLLASKNIRVLAADADPYCINTLYASIKHSGEKNIQPLIIDLSNPSPAAGLNNEERISFINRTNVDLILGLALVHHLAIGKNIPFEKIADMLSRTGTYLILEFVPKDDEKVKEMLTGKKDIYDAYTEKKIVSALSLFFAIKQRCSIGDSQRILFLLERK
jgi:2-polyprenyl-3-methyl-5-hydroxy-6-metoxy-1,4-benzoquinol methylase